jgi:ubiquinone/menaquinone biosynthesis C-methylase UbiE
VILDKVKILDGSLPSPLKLELGCGPEKRSHDAIGIDAIDYPAVDIVGDAYEVLESLPEACVDYISSEHFFEHLEDVPRMLRSIARVMKAGGIVRIVTPHFSNPFFYSDPTHRQFFGLYTFAYYGTESPFRRRVPNYCAVSGLRNQACRLIFKSHRPYYVRHSFKKAVEKMVNLSRYTQELYEENFCYIVPCYEVEYTLIRT